MRRLPVVFVVTTAVAWPLSAQNAAPMTRLGATVGFAADPVTAAVGVEGRHQVGSRFAFSASIGHWFLNERCDNDLVGPCTPSNAWILDVGTTIAFTATSTGWQPYAAIRIGPVRYNYRPSTLWTANSGLGLTQMGRLLGLQIEARYHVLFGGVSPPQEAATDRALLYAGLVVTP
jgi:hypothetical protein